MVKKLVCISVFALFLNPIIAFAGGGHGGHDDGHGDHGEEDGMVRITDVGMEVSDIQLKKTVKGTMILSIDVNGYVVPNEYQTTQVRPRYPGIVKSVFVQLGQTVKKGQRLAVVQANGSETNFNVVSGFSGTVTNKDVVQGQFVAVDHIMFTVSNLKNVWVHLSIPENHIKDVKQGQKVRIIDWTGNHTFTGELSFISSTIYKDSQSTMVRLEVDNSQGVWRPGLFVKAKVYVDSIKGVLSVQKSSLQTLEEKSVVFVEKEEGVFFPQPVKLGRRNDDLIEVVSGLNEGDRYVAKNSYILKADFLKSEASHEH